MESKILSIVPVDDSTVKFLLELAKNEGIESIHLSIDIPVKHMEEFLEQKRDNILNVNFSVSEETDDR